MLLLITPYDAPANWTQRRASVVVSITDDACDLRASGGMNRSLPTGGSAYGMPFQYLFTQDHHRFDFSSINSTP